jgi:hypothetical protein
MNNGRILPRRLETWGKRDEAGYWYVANSKTDVYHLVFPAVGSSGAYDYSCHSLMSYDAIGYPKPPEGKRPCLKCARQVELRL